jgi:hypothetical protein
MSEAMAVETIIEAYWLFRGYWTKLRYPFQTKEGGWSDVDILAYQPEEKVLVISESKARGKKKDVYVYLKDNGYDIFEFDKDGNYLSFLNNIDKLCLNGIIFNNFNKMVDKLIIQLVSNYYIEERALPSVKKDVYSRIKKHIPKNVEVEIRLDTTLEVFCDVIKLANADPMGRRYGHPVMDIAREINRYLNPNICCAGKEREKIKQKLRTIFEKSLEE